MDLVRNVGNMSADISCHHSLLSCYWQHPTCC